MSSQIGELPARCVCLIVDHRWHFHTRIQEDFGRYGIRVEFFLAGTPQDVIPNAPGTDMSIARCCYDHIDESPPTRMGYLAWANRPNSWNAFLSFRKIIELAKEKGAATLLLLEDDAYTTADFPDVVGRAYRDLLEADPAWSMLYLGANHTFSRTEPVTSNLLRVYGSGCFHAVCLNSSVFDTILSLPMEGPIDGVVAKHLHSKGHCYAAWPNTVLTLPGFSYCEGREVDYGEFWKNRGH